MSVTNKYPFLGALYRSKKQVKRLSKTVANSLKDLDNINCTYSKLILYLKGKSSLFSNKETRNAKSRYCNAISAYIQRQQQLASDIGTDFEEAFANLMENFKSTYNSTFLGFDAELKAVSNRIEKTLGNFQTSDKEISEIEKKFENRNSKTEVKGNEKYFISLSRRATDERTKLLKVEKETNDISEEVKAIVEKIDCVYNDLEKLKKTIDKKCALNLVMFEMNMHKSQIHELNNLYDELKDMK